MNHSTDENASLNYKGERSSQPILICVEVMFKAILLEIQNKCDLENLINFAIICNKGQLKKVIELL